MLLLVAAIALWGVVHSMLASLAAKRFVRQVFGETLARLYRLIYNAFAVLTFVPILLWMRSLPDQTLYLVPAPWMYLMLVGQALAAIALLISILQTGALSLFGLRQIVVDEPHADLVTGGFYRYVRHPMYLFSLLVIWLIPLMTVNIFVVYVALTVYAFIGAHFEEKKLLAEYGAAYAAYRSRTPMIIPLRFFGRRQVHVGA